MQNAALLLFFIIFFMLTTPAHANLLLNPSFEDTISGSPSSWTKNVSTATLSTSSTAKTGTSSASINKTNNTTGLIYLYQDVDVETNTFYSLSGWAVKNSPNFNWVILRISWRDASSEISKTDSQQLTSDSSAFQQLKIDSIQTPSQAIKARIELAANIVTINPSNPALFDDIDFSQIPAPDQPTSTPIPTSTPTPTPTKTPTATKVVTPTPTSTKSLITTPKIEESPSAGEAGLVLAENIATETPTPTIVVTAGFMETNLAKFLIVLGGLFLASCGVVFMRWKKEISN